MTPIRVPQLTIDQRPCTFVQWLADLGSDIDEGDWIAELLVDGVLFSLEAPASGRLVKVEAAPGALVTADQEIAWIEREDRLSR